MLNIKTEILNGTTYYALTARNMTYTLSFRENGFVDIWTYNHNLKSHGLPRVVRIGEKMPKAIKQAIELIKSQPVTAA